MEAKAIVVWNFVCDLRKSLWEISFQSEFQKVVIIHAIRYKAIIKTHSKGK